MISREQAAELERLAEAYAQAVREHAVEIAVHGVTRINVRREILSDVLAKTQRAFQSYAATLAEPQP